jgi:hypothetical protein
MQMITLTHCQTKANLSNYTSDTYRKSQSLDMIYIIFKNKGISSWKANYIFLCSIRNKAMTGRGSYTENQWP